MKITRVISVFFLAGALIVAGNLFAAEKKADLSPEEKLNLITTTIQRTLDNMDKNLSEAAKKLSATGLDGPEARNILKELCAKHPNSDSCSTTDANGRLVAIEPEKYKEFEGVDVSYQDQVRELQKTKEPVLSSIFIDVDGVYMIGVEWPVFSKKGKFLGSVDVVGMPRTYFDNAIKPLISWDAVTLWAMQTDGKIIYSSKHATIGSNYVKNEFYNLPNGIDDIAKEIVAHKKGSSVFSSPPTGYQEVVSKRCIWDSVGLHDKEFRIVLFAGPG